MSIVDRARRMQPVDIGVPGPTSLDMARGFRAIRRDPLTFLTTVQQQYGDRVAFPVPGAPALLLNDPADVRHVLQAAARRWSKRTVQYGALARVTGPGLLATSEASWLRHRRAAAPAFHHQHLIAVGEQVEAAADDVLSSLLPVAGDAVVDVAGAMHRIGLAAVGRALFSVDLSGDARDLLRTTGDAAELVVRLGRAVLPTAAWAPTRTNLRVHRARRQLDRATARIVARRRARTPDHAGGHGADLLGQLLDSGLPDAQVRDELVTMVIAGHETVATALSWTLMLLAEHPEVQERVRDELAAHGPASLLDHRERLPYTRAVLEESLRLRPPAWVVSRRAEEDDALSDLPVPAGTVAIISPWLLHRRPDRWPDPEAFRPARFLDGSADRSAHIPFGLGPRLCIGRDFALGEMVLVLQRILSGHVLATPPGWHRPQVQADVAVRPRGGMPLLARPLHRGSGG